MKDHKIEVFDPNKAIMFRNWTNDVFVYPWGGTPYTFQPGETRYFPEGLAHHFAKHLTDVALLKEGKDTDDQARPDMYQKCFVQADPIIASSAVGIEVEMMNQESQEVQEVQKVEEPAEHIPAPVEPIMVKPISPVQDVRIANLAKARAVRAAKLAAEKATI